MLPLWIPTLLCTADCRRKVSCPPKLYSSHGAVPSPRLLGTRISCSITDWWSLVPEGWERCFRGTFYFFALGCTSSRVSSRSLVSHFATLQKLDRRIGTSHRKSRTLSCLRTARTWVRAAHSFLRGGRLIAHWIHILHRRWPLMDLWTAAVVAMQLMWWCVRDVRLCYCRVHVPGRSDV